MSATAVLLMNLGTPAAPEADAVRVYLKEFLTDPYVINIPAIFRYPLVHGIIAPRRAPLSAESYRKVWTDRGSPLMAHSLDLEKGLQQRFGEKAIVKLAMRYGSPSIDQVLQELEAKAPARVILVPLYPQFAWATTRSSLERAEEALSRWKTRPEVLMLRDFPADPSYIDALKKTAEPFMQGGSAPEHWLFSFHGLPVSQVKKADSTRAHCNAGASCCEVESDSNRNCYRAQCFRTAQALARSMGLERSQWSLSFQSRLGRTEWIGPDTESVIQGLAEKGIRHLGIMCPGFVADCLETLEEIGIRGRELFQKHSPHSHEAQASLVPCLNSHPSWIEALEGMIHSLIGESIPA